MSLTSFSRISRRRFAAGALGMVAAAGSVTRSRAQATPSPEASPAASAISPVLRIEYVGGYKPLEFYLMEIPSLLVYADGTVLQPAVTTAIYPPVAIVPFNAFTISEDAVASLIERAIAAGLDEPQQIINSGVMDATDTLITVNIDGKLVTSDIYALDITGPKPEEWDAETTNRFVAIQEFASFARNLATSLDPEDIVKREAPYTPERLEVLAFIPDPANPLPSGVPDLTAQPLIWPLDRSLTEIGAVYERAQNLGFIVSEVRCAEISGSDAKAVVAMAEKGNFISPWKDGEQLYGLLINPLFPGESSCQ